MISRLLRHTTLLYLFALLILLVPTYWTLLKPGVFSMHDFHLFRFFEYEKCFLDLQIPCRWSPDVAFGYGQPLFNFYGQLPYAMGEVFRLFGFSIIDSLKGVFIASLVLSSWGMFLLARQLWKNDLAALISGLVYVYAPYRAVDVYVRGALPEATAFIFFPFITYFFNDYVQKRKKISLLLFGLFFTLLILTHNLSALMYLVFLMGWGLYLIRRENAWRIVPKLFLAGVLAVGLAAFYLLPLVFETQFLTLGNMVSGYYDYNNHFATLRQLLVTRYFDYGASVWGTDDRMSFSVGHVQWILPLTIMLLLLIKKSLRKYSAFAVLLTLGWMMLWLTHNKSVLAWFVLKPIQYLQFPWRFLGMAIFSFALSAGMAAQLLKEKWSKFIVISVIISALIGLNTSFFFEDLWFKVTDKEQFSGLKFEEQMASSVNDYWPNYGSKVPNKLSAKDPVFLEGEGSGVLIEKKSNRGVFDVRVRSESAEVQLPMVYFPGWTGELSGASVEIYPKGELGLITAKVGQGDHRINLIFENTPVRVISNVVSLLSLTVFAWLVFKFRKESDAKV